MMTLFSICSLLFPDKKEGQLTTHNRETDDRSSDLRHVSLGSPNTMVLHSVQHEKDTGANPRAALVSHISQFLAETAKDFPALK